MAIDGDEWRDKGQSFSGDGLRLSVAGRSVRPVRMPETVVQYVEEDPFAWAFKLADERRVVEVSPGRESLTFGQSVAQQGDEIERERAPDSILRS